MQLLFIFIASFLCFQLHAQTAADPSEPIRIEPLANGLRVVYAPSERAKTVQVRVVVDAGSWTEEKSGTAHLLEHYIFKDGKMSKDMTYMEVIKENGGSGNAFVIDESTTYYATVPPAKAAWLVKIFGKMLVNKEFIEEDVQFAKKPVYLEIGQPNPTHYFWAFRKKFIPNFTLFPTFWESEFNFESPPSQAIPDQISTASLTRADLEEFYKKYYHARNMTLFIAGNFDYAEIAKEVAASFEKMPAAETKGIKEKDLKAREGNYLRTQSTPGTPQMSVGTKIADLGLTDTMAVYVYINHLSHRLMKEIRNLKGETYTARPDIDIRRRNGYAAIEMEAPPEAFKKNLALVRDYIEREARQSQITEGQFNRAKSLYLQKFDLTDMDSDTMMDLAETKSRYMDEYGADTPTLYQIVSSLTLEGYKESLKKAFAPNMRMEKLSEPPLFWRYEEFALLFLGLFLWSRLTKKIFLRNFVHKDLRLARKLAYPPLYLAQAGMIGIAALIYLLSLALVWHFWSGASSLQSSIVVADYIPGQISLGLMFICLQFSFSLVPRKIMIVGESLWLKSLGYSSTVVPFSEIEELSLMNPVSTLLRPKLLWRIGWRFFVYNPQFWRPALLLNVRGGKSYLLGLSEARETLAELQDAVHRARPAAAAEKAA
jgi:predicted Zn-dependent peptidase